MWMQLGPMKIGRLKKKINKKKRIKKQLRSIHNFKTVNLKKIHSWKIQFYMPSINILKLLNIFKNHYKNLKIIIKIYILNKINIQPHNTWVVFNL